LSTSQIKTIGDTARLYTRNALSHAIRTAVDLGIVRALQAGQKTVSELAEECQLAELPLEKLMSLLTTTELIEQYKDYFALSASAQLIPELYLDFGDRYWKNLAYYVRTGNADTENSTGSRTRDEDYLMEAWSREWMLTPAAIDLTSLLDIGKSRRALRVLNLGCGTAVFSAALIHQDPNSTAMLVDTEAGLARARATIDSIGIQNKIEWVTASDIFNVTEIEALADQQFDLILLAGTIHRISSQSLEVFLPQLSHMLSSNAELAIVDMFPGQPGGAKELPVAELELCLRTQQGQLHNPTELQAMLKRTGYRNIQFAHLPSPPYIWGLVLAQLEALSKFSN